MSRHQYDEAALLNEIAYLRGRNTRLEQIIDDMLDGQARIGRFMNITGDDAPTDLPYARVGFGILTSQP